jgi:hypothetical protein
MKFKEIRHDRYLNFDELKQSPFFKLGQSRYNFKYGDGIVNPEWISVELCTFDLSRIRTQFDSDTNPYLPTNYNSVISTLSPSVSGLMNNHLSMALAANYQLIPNNFRLLIANQWTEINAAIKRLNIQDKITRALLIIQDPGTYVPPHGHSHVEQTVTFVYSYPNNKLNEGENNVKFYLSTDEVRKIEYPEDNKFYFTFDGKTKHDASTTMWRFYWIFDTPEKYELNRKLNHWKFLETGF